MASAVRQLPGNLPAGLASFVGRGDELARIEERLGSSRLVTVTGTGGVGKTRTALRAAERVGASYPGGVWLVRLSQLRDGALVAHAVARALSLQDQTSRPMVDVLADHLSDRRSLLILDTCEHLVDSCALLVTALLEAAPGLSVIATSREPLRVKGEARVAVEPLPEADSARLFGERAGAGNPEFALSAANRDVVERLCRSLDGLPLALELAAALVRDLPVERLASLLDDRLALLTRPKADSEVPPRHETLRAAIGWSHELCAPAERLLWARTSVFAGSFTREAAADVCSGGPLTPGTVPATLDALARKSIVVEEDGRYRLLDTVREYGASWLDELGETDEVRLRHRDHYLNQARRAFPQWTREGQLAWYRRMADDYADVRVALETSLAEPGTAALEMTGALWFFWFSCGFQREGRDYLERALAHSPEPGPLWTRAAWAHGCVVLSQGDLAATDRSIDACLATGDPDAALAAGYLEAASCTIRALPQRALELLDALDVSPARGGLHEAIWMLAQTASAFGYVVSGRLPEATELAERIRAESVRRGECKSGSWGHYVQALADLGLGHPDSSAEHARAALAGNIRLGDSWGMALAVDVLAMATGALGDGERAALLLGIGERLWRRTHGRSQFGSPELTAARKECERRLRAAIGDEAHEAAYAKGLGTEPEFALAD
ncbi:ATP-binding protein [Spirillospora sp. CA-294931]|uniref:ATP-binding protein n=1 Tax=Spirillospora sp. CA-294931 TaxID=3240042 RepID=UPI003D910D54